MKILALATALILVLSVPAFAERPNREKILPPAASVPICPTLKSGKKVCLKWKSGRKAYLRQIPHKTYVQYTTDGVILNIREPK